MSTGTKRVLEEDSDHELVLYTKYAKIVPDISLKCYKTALCSHLIFANESDLTFHHQSEHNLPCSICKRLLLSHQLLHLHLLEVHDSFFQVMAERKKSVIPFCLQVFYFSNIV